jgi:hypothetical protein
LSALSQIHRSDPEWATGKSGVEGRWSRVAGREQEYSTLIPYFKQGIVAGELVFNVIDRAREPDHRTRLVAAGLNVGGPVTVATSEETYLAGGRFDMERMCDFIRDTLVDSAMSGKRVRTAGWMDWIHREVPGTERTMEYEARMNLLVPTFDCTFMCVYDLSKLTGGMIADIMATHPYVIMNGQIRQNSFYIEPDRYLRELVTARKAPSATGP